MLQQGQAVSVNYSITLDNELTYFSTWKGGSPAQMTIGDGSILPSFERELVSMNPGERKSFRLEPSEAFGEYDPNGIIELSAADVPRANELPVGKIVEFETTEGKAKAKVMSVDDVVVRLDLNHELAGQALNIEIELL